LAAPPNRRLDFDAGRRKMRVRRERARTHTRFLSGMSEAGRKIATLAASLLITLAVFAAAEMSVRLLAVDPGPWPSADNPLALPQIENDPLIGPLPRPGWAGDWFGLFPTEIDARGFRSTGYPPPNPSESRVAFLGDSCSFGWGVVTDETFVAQLDAWQRQAGTPSKDLMNAAYPGQSAVVGELMLRQRVLPLDPDVVVIGYSANNAFRFSLLADKERYRYFGLRKLLLRSRLFHILAAGLARSRTQPGHPRNRAAVSTTPFAALRRVASTDEYDAALRAMVEDARRSGARPVFLLLPRACQVSELFGYEDSALSNSRNPMEPRVAGKEFIPRELGLIENSCLDHREFDDPVAVLRERIGAWKTVYPADEDMRIELRNGARAYVEGDNAKALRIFDRAVAQQADSPLALYDRGVVRLILGDREQGLRDLDESVRLSCNVFVQYNVVAWKVAVESDVPVADLTLRFQAREGELFLDPAHPTAEGHRLIAQELQPLIDRPTAVP
jgi:lysophospholipase L1-like esterase